MATTHGAYMTTDAWKESTVEPVFGRPTKVWKQRPRRIVELLNLAAASPDQDLLVQGDRRISFASFLDAVEVGASVFEAAGVTRDDRVLIVLYNSAEFVLAQWAAWRLGAVAVLGNRWWSRQEFADVTARVRPRLLITDLEPPAGFEEVPVVTPAQMADWWSTDAAAVIGGDRDTTGDEDDVALILFTAGSTGAPKGVQLSHRNLWATQQTLHVMRGGRPPAATSPGEQSVALMTTPLFHLGGVTACLTALLDGNRIVLPTGRFDPLEVLELVQRERVSSWNAVPTMYGRVLGHPRFKEFDLSSLKAPSTGGTMVSPVLLEVVRQQLPDVANGIGVGWGMTEAAFLTIATGAEVEQRPGTVGCAIPGVEVRVVDPDEDGAGELVARSAAVMVGYLDAERQPIDDDGWYHTGDIGRIDEDGYVYITGRSIDMVIRGGENVACPHVERTIAEHPAVKEAAVFGIPDEEYGEQLAAVVYVPDSSDVDIPDLVQFAKERLAHFEVPTSWSITREQLPTLPTGKLDKQLLRVQLIGA